MMQTTKYTLIKDDIFISYFSDGGSHSGMFCGASFLLERLKIEQDVNAVLAVRYVSRHRPQFFEKLVSNLVILN